MRAVVSGCWATISCYVLEQHKQCNGLHNTNILLHLSAGTSWNGKNQVVAQKKVSEWAKQVTAKNGDCNVTKSCSIKKHSCVEKRQISRKPSCACVKTNNHLTKKGLCRKKYARCLPTLTDCRQTWHTQANNYVFFWWVTCGMRQSLRTPSNKNQIDQSWLWFSWQNEHACPHFAT